MSTNLPFQIVSSHSDYGSGDKDNPSAPMPCRKKRKIVPRKARFEIAGIGISSS